MAKWRTDGKISRNSIVDKLIPSVEGVLVSTGQYGVREMRELEKEQVTSGASGRLHDSIMFATKEYQSGMGAEAKQSDALDKPDTHGVVAMGSQVPWAYYVEVGSTKHMNKEGHDAFIDSLKDWYQRAFGKNPDAPENYASFNALYEKIVKEGTKDKPFVFPVYNAVRNYAKKMIAAAINMNNYAVRGARRGARK